VILSTNKLLQYYRPT